MLIIGCDFHPGFQQVAIFDNLTGEIQEKRLQHRAEAEQFYRSLAGQAVRVGMEACGHYPWFERLLQELGMELWFGDAARVRASVVRRQKTDRRDAEHLLQLLMENRFPPIWVPSLEVRDLPQLLVHRLFQLQAQTHSRSSCSRCSRAMACKKSESFRRRWGARSWSSCLCCRTRPSGGSGCWKRSTNWKRRSSSSTGLAAEARLRSEAGAAEGRIRVGPVTRWPWC